MESSIEAFLTQGVFAFMLTFIRVGSALMLMPGIGDTFTPMRIRLLIALSISFCIVPIVASHLPAEPPSTILLFSLLGAEFIVGIFIGMIARILLAALDTAGMVISLMSGLANAQVFNPGFSSQGSLPGALLTMTGVMIVFATNMHHFLIWGVIGSYDVFPVGEVPDTGGMAQIMTQMVVSSFLIGVQIAAPFFVISLLVYIAMGVMARLMPQVQVFLLALPLQIVLSLVCLFMIISSALLFWLSEFEQGMVFFLSNTGF